MSGAAPLNWEPRLREVSRIMGQMGCGSILTGQLGDLVMGNWVDDSEQVAGHLAKRHYKAALQEAFTWSRTLRRPIYPILWNAVSLCCSPRRLPTQLNPNPRRDLKTSLSAQFRRRAFDIQRSRSAPAWLKHVDPARHKHFLGMYYVLSSRLLQCPEPMEQFDCTHPYVHRPLVEFMLTIPAHVVCGPGTPRKLMRKAFSSLLPKPLLARRSKASYDKAYRNAIRPFSIELLRTMESTALVDLGYVDRDNLRGRLERSVAGLECNEAQLRNLILLEFWLRNRA